VGAPHSEIDQRAPARSENATRGLAGDDGLKVQQVDEARLDQLSLGQWCVTRTTGSLAKNTVPSGNASTLPLKRSRASRSRNAGLNRPVDSSQARSSLPKRSPRDNNHCSSPAAIRSFAVQQAPDEELEYGGLLQRALKYALV
jgi:hypothetical protein